MADNNIMGWDDEISIDSSEFVVLDEGEYDFTVTKMERGRFPGSAKIQPCNKATLTLKVTTAKGDAIFKTDLILYRTLEWKISSFFRSIGQKKHGEKLVMDWNKVVGAFGRAYIVQRKWTNNSGVEMVSNEVDHYLDPAENSKSDAFAGFQAIGGSDKDLPF